MYVQMQNFGHTSTVKSSYYCGKYACNERIHQFPEIVCVLEGSVEITVNGVKEIANAGDIAVIAPFQAHSFFTPEFCRIWVGVVSGDLAADYFSGDNAYTCGIRAVFTPTGSLTNYVIEHIPREMREPEELTPQDATYRRVKALLYAVLEEYVAAVPQVKVTVKKGALSSLFLYISSHFREALTLSGVAAALGYTPTYLSHVIAAVPNMSFRRILNSMRVNHAKGLLISTEMTLGDLAVACGFSEERTFYRAFLDLVGMTPGAYRRQQRGPQT